jgi:serine-type D-Ala-D-Ala carboxypeptidase (penicillin-binding protein 5/6)
MPLQKENRPLAFLYSGPTLLATMAGLVYILGKASPPATTDVSKTTTESNVTVSQQINSLEKPAAQLPTIPATKPSIAARSYIIIDSKTKYPLAAKDPDKPVAIASTTKVMTALVAIETLEADKVVTITPNAATINGSEIQLLTGEKVTVKNLLYALLISSANDAAYALADAGGGKEAFVAKMNKKAETLGLKNTHYNDPAGLDDTGHSTPRDLALLTNYALSNPTFRTIVATPLHTIWSADEKYKHDLKNSNRLIVPDDPLFYSQAIGVKTGFTYEAGHCLIAAAETASVQRYVAVVLHTNSDANEASAREAKKLLQWANPN